MNASLPEVHGQVEAMTSALRTLESRGLLDMHADDLVAKHVHGTLLPDMLHKQVSQSGEHVWVGGWVGVGGGGEL